MPTPSGSSLPISSEEWRFWRRAARLAVKQVSSPCFIFAAEPLVRQLGRLEAAFAGLPVRHWWSFKTLPLPEAVRWWIRQGRPVEVVSEAELRTVLEVGCEPGSILVNGPAKHTWLGQFRLRGLGVNFDSLSEVKALGPRARRDGWRVGVRLNLSTETNFEYPAVRAQFGFAGEEAATAARWLRRLGLEVEMVHFHLRTNVPEARYYREAIAEAMARAGSLGWKVAVLDIGGGFPPDRVGSRKGAPLNAGFSLGAMRTVVQEAVARHGLQEIWMENGRWLTAPSGVLAIRVLDVKEDPVRGMRTLICDGGRTLHAMVATWEKHALLPLARRRANSVRTMVYGPTCMAFDNLGVHEMSSGVGAGDLLLWFDAGAYQLGWETRFSHGLAGIVWVEGKEIWGVRPKVHCQPGASP